MRSVAPLLVLASASPARLRTLQAAGIDPVVHVSDVDEPATLADAQTRYGAMDPDQAALVLARAKAEDVATRIAADHVVDPRFAGALVLGADSVLELDGEMHGKPADSAEAVARWQRMRGRSGVLHTGHWLVDLRDQADGGTDATIGALASTAVHFATISDDEIEAYVATGEPLKVAGAFTTDGLGGAFVRGIEGDPHTVVGLSLPLLRDLLADCGVSWVDLWDRPAPE